jgi:uracil phosphoribosyltransferase
VLEVCPGSNLALGLYPRWQDHPIERLRAREVKVTVSTDDPPFFHTTMTREFDRLADAFGWDEDRLPRPQPHRAPTPPSATRPNARPASSKTLEKPHDRTPYRRLTIHPLVQHKLTLMREKETSTKSFRQLLREISHLLAYEVTRELPMTTKRIETPLCEMDAPVIEGKKLALISILRAGNGLLDGILELVPAARVGFVGLYRDPETLQPVQYYFKVPSELEDRICIVVDPMLATGNSSVAAVDLLKKAGARSTSASCAFSPRPRGWPA